MRQHKDPEARKLRAELRRIGLSNDAIEAAWPAWWSDEASQSPSARAELRFTLARLLGISPKSILGERVEFVWKDSGRFKHLMTETVEHQAALTSFCVSVGRMLLRATDVTVDVSMLSPADLRRNILQGHPHVDLISLLAVCWAGGVPVVHLRVFPLETKSMDAIVVRSGNRHAVLMGKDSQFPAPIAFSLAHELGHIHLGHVPDATILVDVDRSIGSAERDEEEIASHEFALELLTGSPKPDIRTDILRFSSNQLAHAAMQAGAERQIEPGTLALCVGYQYQAWSRASAALPKIYLERKPVWQEVNRVAASQLQWHQLRETDAQYLLALMGIEDDGPGNP